MASKRKRNDLTIQQKYEILQQFKSGKAMKDIATEYAIDRSKIKSKEEESQIDGLDDFVTKICLRKKKQTIISDYFVKL